MKARRSVVPDINLFAVSCFTALALVACGGSEIAKPDVEDKRVGAEVAGTDVSDQPAQGNAEQTARVRREQARVAALIRKKVERYWLRPAGWTKGMDCVVRVRLAPTGELLSATIARSSGSPAFDRSVENAVYKAAPLPLPEDKALFEHFRELELRFRPEGQT